MLPLDDLKMSDMNTDAIVLLKLDGDTVFQDQNYLKLLCESVDEIKSWRESFSRVFNNDGNVRFLIQYY